MAAATAVTIAVIALAAGCGRLASDDDEPSPAGDSSSDPAIGSESESTAGSDPATGGTLVEVERIIDGDSLELLIDGEVVEARLRGINAPELWTLGGTRSCAGDAATDELASLIEGRSVVVTGEEVDRFDRLLVEIDLDGRSVATAMVDAGWALALWSSDDPALIDSMTAAAQAGRGWWGDTCGPPTSNAAVIADTVVDAPGDDRNNLDEEWVAVGNDGEQPLDLDGWVIRDETTSNRFLIERVVIQPGQVVRFRTGPGPGSPSSDGPSLVGDDYYLAESHPVWSNRGETVLLVDPDGIVAAWAFVP